jgi:phage terminase large subunit-like protein
MTVELQTLTEVDPYWIRSDVDRLAIEEGCYFDESAGQLICDFIEQFCRQSQGKWAGQLIVLMDWQRDFLMRLYGWKRPGGFRRFETVYLEVAKKNGKTTMIGGVALTELELTDEGGPQIYLNAAALRQTETMFSETVHMVNASPEIKGRVTILKSKNRIFDPERNGFIEALSSTIDVKDGFNPSVVIIDEVHRLPDRKLHDVFKYAMGARDQPLTINITTAGENDLGIWHALRVKAEEINAGIGSDTTFLGVVYRALPDDNIDDPATWVKANPSMGLILSQEKFAKELEEAKKDPIELANFKRFKLNIVTPSAQKFFDMAKWDACNGVPDRLPHRKWYAGLDLSSTTDLSALVLIRGDEASGFDLIARFWLPKDNIEALEQRDRQPYRIWEEQGILTLTPGCQIDYAFIRAEIVKLHKENEIVSLFADDALAFAICSALMEENGIPVEYIIQGFRSLGPPTKELGRLTNMGKIRHGGHPILRWMASNAVVVHDAAANPKIHKEKSRLKIDGIAATVDAVAAYMGNPDTSQSVYETRGVIFV